MENFEDRVRKEFSDVKADAAQRARDVGAQGEASEALIAKMRAWADGPLSAAAAAATKALKSSPTIQVQVDDSNNFTISVEAIIIHDFNPDSPYEESVAYASIVIVQDDLIAQFGPTPQHDGVRTQSDFTVEGAETIVLEVVRTAALAES